MKDTIEFQRRTTHRQGNSRRRIKDVRFEIVHARLSTPPSFRRPKPNADWLAAMLVLSCVAPEEAATLGHNHPRAIASKWRTVPAESGEGRSQNYLPSRGAEILEQTAIVENLDAVCVPIRKPISPDTAIGKALPLGDSLKLVHSDWLPVFPLNMSKLIFTVREHYLSRARGRKLRLCAQGQQEVITLVRRLLNICGIPYLRVASGCPVLNRALPVCRAASFIV